MKLVKNIIRKLKLSILSDFLVVLSLIALNFNLIFPSIAQAKTIDNSSDGIYILQELVIDYSKPKGEFKNRLPKNEDRAARWSTYITVTAYSSTVDQCDSTPCISASGFNLCEHNREDIIATNYLPMGTKVKFPELYGDKIFTVEDRMNARYYKRADFWMKTRDKAKQFGLQYIKMEVL